MSLDRVEVWREIISFLFYHFFSVFVNYFRLDLLIVVYFERYSTVTVYTYVPEMNIEINRTRAGHKQYWVLGMGPTH